MWFGLAVAEVFNGNLEQALLSIRKQLQRDRTLMLVRLKVRFLRNADKRKRRKEDNVRRHIRKKNSASSGGGW